MKFLSVFNNKGGVGKTTLSFHLAHALAELGKKVLMVDADPQCNLTIYTLSENTIQKLWEDEEPFLLDWNTAKQNHNLNILTERARSLHFYLKPTEDGEAADQIEPIPVEINSNLFLMPGRLTFHSFEERLVSNWSGILSEDNFSIGLATSIRRLIQKTNIRNNFDYAIIDTSPSLGRLNRLLLATSDFFIIPCTPDFFSLYGIKNIGTALKLWRKEFDTFVQVISKPKLSGLPNQSARFVGFSLLNCRRRSDSKNKYHVSLAAYRYVEKIPGYIRDNIPFGDGDYIDNEPIGGNAIIHSHGTMPSVSQTHHVPMWKVPLVVNTSHDDYYSIMANKKIYEGTKEKYHEFARDLENRINTIGQPTG